MPLPEISEQHLLFVQEFVKDRNKVRAGLAAKLSPTYQGASAAARALLQKPPIKRWVRHLLGQQAKALKFKPSKVLRNWMVAATADLTYFEVDGDGRLTTAPGVPREFLRAVRKVKQTRTETLTGRGDAAQLEVTIKTDIELRDPFGPECKLMEHFGELEDKAKPGVSLDVVGRVLAHFADELAAARDAAGRAAADGGGGAVGGEPGSAG